VTHHPLPRSTRWLGSPRHDVRGQGREQTAADCYRKAVEIIRERPQQYDPEFANTFLELIDKLDPPTAAPNP